MMVKGYSTFITNVYDWYAFSEDNMVPKIVYIRMKYSLAATYTWTFNIDLIIGVQYSFSQQSRLAVNESDEKVTAVFKEKKTYTFKALLKYVSWYTWKQL